ncbi:endonuclease/exonuclease/phosphatase family protein [Verrucomicrobium sp. BvORR034]|uniref:endonuclease/exonuclease/phosphatase family protein n=1 Tax=Verrucomicrobium sp. BvORR034 TaxID=1396418 RepID=UPI000678B535|nr:endonuclease/exonuclease/phosphatase family protein [Verrucomicrobium sp. BvORR034]
MFDRIESFFHRLRRRVSRSEWAIRHLGLKASEDTGEEPGLLLIQIDGLARHQLEAAMKKGRMPFLKKLVDRSEYHLTTFYSGLPSTTPAVQAELYYGVHAGVPAFSFRDRSTGETGMMFYSEWAKKFEAEFQSRAEGLLKGGSSWSNIYSGGADLEESHFCAASNGLGDMWRSGKFRNMLLFAVLNIPAVLRILGLLLLELVIAVPLALIGVIKGQGWGREMSMVLSRTFIGIGLREVVTIGGKVDVTRGLPIVHLNFLGYDELAHRRGPGSQFAHWSLKGIDRAIKNLYRAAHRSRRRDYQVWIFSDHGQERSRSFATEIKGGIEAVIADCLGVDPPTARKSDAAVTSNPSCNTQAQKRRSHPDASVSEGEMRRGFTVAAVGPVGHVYFNRPVEDGELLRLARQLVQEKQVPGVLMKQKDGRITWYHAGGKTSVPEGAADLFARHPEGMRQVLAEDLVTFCNNPNAGDLVLLGWGPQNRNWTFAEERGSHAGAGPEETQGFLLVPPATRGLVGGGGFVRPDRLRAAALHHLGRDSDLEPHADAGDGPVLRVMSYNAHSCIGMDGRVSPRRIARVINHYSPDLVAVQELEHGRSRSRGEDQATRVAELTGYEVVFCPTVTRAAERYGHALLSRRPVEVVKTGQLPADPGNWWPEPRSAIWVRTKLEGQVVNMVATHLGLSSRERVAQMLALLGPDWLGPVVDKEPVVLCGDFNFGVGSPGYKLAITTLRDVQRITKGWRPVNTFSSLQPFIRLDHVFVSSHFDVEKLRVPRTQVTRVASDHLPLVADLRLSSSAAAETTTPKAP